MILTIDIGNSNIVSVTYEKYTRLLDDRRETVRNDDEAIQRRIFSKIKEEMNLSDTKLEFIILSCVVPAITNTVIKVLEEVFSCPVKTFSSETIKDMKVLMDNPKVIGSDLLATNVGAFYKYKSACIISDFGSASKIMAVDDSFTFVGGIIMPGIKFQAKSLHDMIPHLPVIDIKKPSDVLGHDTISSIQSGIINGTYQATIGLCKEIGKKQGIKFKWILTGGLAKLFPDCEKDGFIYDEFLLSDGLNYIANEYLKEE